MNCLLTTDCLQPSSDDRDPPLKQDSSGFLKQNIIVTHFQGSFA